MKNVRFHNIDIHIKILKFLKICGEYDVIPGLYLESKLWIKLCLNGMMVYLVCLDYLVICYHKLSVGEYNVIPGLPGLPGYIL